MNATEILQKHEIVSVLTDLQKRRNKSANVWANLIVFRLSCCCGLRVKELCGINIGDVLTDGDRPCVRVRKEVTKGQEGKRRQRFVPLWWDSGTLADLAEWKGYRMANAAPGDPFVCGQSNGSIGKRLTEDLAAKRWKTAIKCLGKERVKQLHIHCGRHSFCSHALFSGRTLVEVRDAAGHSNIITTSLYLHLIENRDLPDLFEMEP